MDHHSWTKKSFTFLMIFSVASLFFVVYSVDRYVYKNRTADLTVVDITTEIMTDMSKDMYASSIPGKGGVITGYDVATIYLNATGNMENDSIPETKICKSSPKFEDWRFDCFEKCPQAIQMPRLKSLNVPAVCSDLETANLTRTHISEDRYIYTVPYNSKCLKRLIQTYCKSSHRVPNIAHYIWFTRHEMKFFHFLSFLSVVKIQKPCLIFLHANFLPFGTFWNYTLYFINNIIHVNVDPPQQIFGRVFGYTEHKADVHRLRCLRDYGGMYFDVDQILLKSLDTFRNNSFTQSIEVYDYNLANSLLISVPNAEFVNIWLDSYRAYNKGQWGFHSTILPFHLSKKYPNLIHIANNSFVKPNYQQMNFIFNSNYNWSTNYALHTYMRFYQNSHNLNDIRKLNTTIGSVSRFILYNSKELCYNP